MEFDFAYIAIVIVVILFSMMLHEAMHGFTAFWLGDDTAEREGRLTLNPIRHIDPFLTILLPVMLAIIGAPVFGGAKPVPFNPARLKYDEWGAALVSLAGPLTNLLIAFVLFGSFAISGVEPNSLAGRFLTIGVMVNLGFFIFNMIPIPPLDGSRVIYALAPEFVRRGMQVIEQYGLVLIFAIVLLASPLLGRLIQTGGAFFIEIFSAVFGI